MPKSRNHGKKYNANKLRKLRRRLTPEQLAARQQQRQEKMMWRKQVEDGIGQSFQNSTAVGQYSVRNFKRQRTINWCFAVILLALAVKVIWF